MGEHREVAQQRVLLLRQVAQRDGAERRSGRAEQVGPLHAVSLMRSLCTADAVVHSTPEPGHARARPWPGRSGHTRYGRANS
ncbi:hypothetical protein GCM10028771_11930 [Nocardioides marmoraquaticus]